MKTILFLTGTRADFGKIKPLISACGAGGFDVRIFATGMHMQAAYGLTHLEIKKAGFDYFPFYNCAPGMDGTLAATITGLSNYVRENRPDLIVVHGDRVEALAGACVGALNNILVAHVEGGEVSGTVDESIRHAVTKLAHLHFVSNEEARARLLQMGEAEASVYVIGSPEIDVMLGPLPSLGEVRAKYGIVFPHYSVCIYHPVTTEPVSLRVFDALEEDWRNYVIIYPNNDTGADKIIERIKRMAGPRFLALPSMRFEYFLTLLKHADFIIGNSSAGVREAPVYGVPTIDIGTRQAGRYNGPSVAHVPDNIQAIGAAIKKPPARYSPSLHFGRGDSAARFVAALNAPQVWATSPQKEFHGI